MKACIHCNHILEDETNFCPNCGWNQAEAGQSTAGAEQPTAADSTQSAPITAPAETQPEAFSAQNTIPSQKEDGNTFADLPTWNVADGQNDPASQQGEIIGMSDGPTSILMASTASKKKLPLIIGIGVIAALLIGIAIYMLLQLFQSPHQKFVSYQKGFVVDQLLSTTETAIKEYNSASDFSGDINISAQLEGNALLESYLEGTSIDLKMDMAKDSGLINMNVNLMGSQVLAGLISYKDGVLGVALPELNDNLYTFDMKEYAKKNGIENIEDFQMPEISTETMMSLGKLYSGIILGTVNADNLTFERNADILLPNLGETVKGDLYIFKPKAADVENMLLKLADSLENDQALRKFIKDIIGNNSVVYQNITGYDHDVDIEKSLEEMVKALRENAKEMGETVESSEFRWVLGVSGGKIVLQSLSTADGTGFSYEATGDGEKEKNISISVESFGATQIALESSWTKDGNTYDGNFKILSFDETPITGKYTVDSAKKSKLGVGYGNYSFAFNDGESTLDVKIDVQDGENGGTDHILTLGGNLLDYAIDLTAIKLNINSSDDDSTAAEPSGDPVDITNYSEEELQELIGQLGNDITEDIMGKIFASAGIFG